MKENNVGDLIAISIWAFVAIGISPIYSSLAFQQLFDFQSQKIYNFYNNPVVIGFLFVIMGISILAKFYPSFKSFIIVDIHNPRFSFLPKSFFLTFVISAILFLGFFGISLSDNAETYKQFAVPLIPQSALTDLGIAISNNVNLGRLAFGVEPASFVETIFVFGVAIVSIILWRFLKNLILFKFKIPEIINKSGDYLAFVTGYTIGGLFLHIAIYKANEQALAFTLFFWFISSVIILFWNSLVPAIVLHESFNLTSALVSIYGVEIAKTTIFISVFVLAILGVLYVWRSRSKGGVGQTISYG